MHDQTFFDIEQVVKNDPKGRYSLIEEGGVWFIRANQGHSIKVCTYSPIYQPASLHLLAYPRAH